MAPQYKPREVKARQPSLHPESKQQISCVTWFRYQYPKYKKLLFAIPNGGKRTKAEAVILVEEGVVAGVPDLMLAVPRRGYHGMFIEQKYKNAPTSDNQDEMIKNLQEQGYYCVICRSFEQFIQLITDYL